MSEQKKSRNPLKVIVPVLLVAGIGFGVWKLVFSRPAEPANIVALTGRIEGDDSAISPKVSGRLLEIRYREGDLVKAGEIIATLDGAQVRAREDQARDSLTAAEAQLRSAQQQTAILQDQLNQMEMQTGQASLDADSRVREAEAQLSTAEAQLAQQEASMKLAAYDRDAYTRLAKDGAVSERLGKQAQTTAESQEALVAAAKRTVESVRAAVNVAKANLTTPQIRTSQQAAIRKQMAQQQATIASAAADAARSREQVVEAQENLKDLTVIAPFEGSLAGHAHGGTWRGGAGGDADCDAARFEQSLPAGLRTGRSDRADQAGAIGACVSGFGPERKPLDAVVSRIDPRGLPSRLRIPISATTA